MAGSFRDLNIWQTGHNLALEVRKFTTNYPKEEKFGLIDQTNRSSTAIPALIAESHGRYFYKDKIRVLYESRGEIDETRSHLSLAVSLEYIKTVDFQKLDLEYEHLSRSVSSYIRSLNPERPENAN